MTLQSVRQTSIIRAAMLGLGVWVLAAAAAAQTQTVWLVSGPVTKTVMLPSGASVAVPMWGFGLDANMNGQIDGGETITVPGPRIVVAPGTVSLTINLTNHLPEDVSIVVPGQQASGTPVFTNGRIVSLAPVAPKDGGSASYEFQNVRAGTFLYQSGAHQAVQVPMGLYGALTKDADAGLAYAGVGYTNELLLLYSEVDVALNRAVTAGQYGPDKAVTSTIDSAPTIFLVNGESYRRGMEALPAGTVAARTLVRLLNAGSESHVAVLAPPQRETAATPIVDEMLLSVVAEDGNVLTDPRGRASVLLPAGKTHDAIWVPTEAGEYSVYDRALRLQAHGEPNAGLLARLRVGALDGVPVEPGLATTTDQRTTAEDTPLTSPSVLANDANGGLGLVAELHSSPSAGTLQLNADGTFVYTPQANFSGVDGFWYRAVDGSMQKSGPTLVSIVVGPVPDAPVAFQLALGVTAGASKAITVSGLDADGDSLSYYVSSLPDPAHGVLKVGGQTLTAAHLYGEPGAIAIPAGTVTYAAAVGGVGSDAFQFRAYDGGLASAPQTVNVKVDAPPAPAIAGDPVSITLLGVDTRQPGAAPVPVAGGYRWTLEEDRTYQVQPGQLDPNTLSVSFHRSYMPVLQSGDENTSPRLPALEAGLPAKKFFLSVLPKESRYSVGGTALVSGQATARVIVNQGPVPTAQIRIRIFADNSPLNGQYDTDEAALAGFHVYLDDAGGRYGISGGQMMQDAFGNPIGTTYQACTAVGGCESPEVATRGEGFLISDAEGFVTFQNLRPGKYTAKVIPPPTGNWQQTTTIEGTKGIDAWVKANEPTFFSEFGPAGPHIEVGFVHPTRDTTILGAGAGPFRTISGTVTHMHMSRPPEYRMFSGAPFDYTRAWVGLNTGTAGSAIYAQPTDAEGYFTINGVPPGSYTLVVWDSALDVILASKAITVAASDVALGEVPVFPWFTRLYHYVFEDTNLDGQRQPGERGIGDVPVNTRWRDGSIYQASATDGSGFVPFEETFPFFAWQVAEVDFTRFRATGVTVVTDNGGDVSANTGWPELVGAEADARVLAPQPQVRTAAWKDSENVSHGGVARTETGPALLQAFQGFIGQTNLFLWGKAAYTAPGVFPPDVDVAPFDSPEHPFPEAGTDDVDGNGNGRFDADEFNGGISGIVHYSSTRAENNPRWGTAEPWEPGIPGVRVQLWDATRTRLLNEVTTDSWDDSLPAGCQGTPFTYLGQNKDCYDGLRNFNQVRPGVFDGGYAFTEILEPYEQTVDGTTVPLPLEQRTIRRSIPAGQYVVKVIPPQGYQLVKEEDKNVDFGEEYVPAQFFLQGYPLADAAGGEAQPRNAYNSDPLVAPFCVGDLHAVPPALALFPGIPGAYANTEMPLCDEKMVTLRNGANGAANFFLFTEAPVSGHIVGFVLDDLANEFDQNSPQFGEKYAPPFLPVSVRDWTGREVTHTYTDRYGVYNALVPSTFTAATPIPSGMSPNMLTACINSPLTGRGPNGELLPDPFYNKQYTQFCYTFQYMPGTTTYLDTPVLPVGAFTGPGQVTLDAEFADRTPVIKSVTGAAGIGPYIVPVSGTTPEAMSSRQITITAVGAAQVPNPAFDPSLALDGQSCSSETPPASCKKSIERDYGFGETKGRVYVGNTLLPSATVSWTSAAIVAEVPAGTKSGQLRVVRCLDAACASTRASVLGVTLTVATPTFHAARPPIVVEPGGSIQQAIDGARPGDLVLVKPGTYEGALIMDKPVRLQGWGAAATTLNAVKVPAERLQEWRNRVFSTVTTTPAYLLPFQQSAIAGGFDQTGELLGPILGGEGAAVTVLAQNLPLFGASCPQVQRPGSQAYGLQMENYLGTIFGIPFGGDLAPKARVDGFSLTGSDQAAGIEVNAFACNLQVSNNHIYSNTGDFAGGVKIGHPGEAVELADQDAHNDYLVIANNHVNQNGSLNGNGGGAIAIGAGAQDYRVTNNFVVGNLTAGFGAGISHIGRSTGRIADNVVVFNEAFNQSTTTSGGGIFIGGRAPAAGEAAPGAGRSVVANNLIQGNSASGGDGGGIAIANINGQPSDGVDLFGNIIVNNVAGLAGGGIALENARNVRILHQTIARNDSLAVAGAAFTPRVGLNDPLVSTPQPAGIVSRGQNNDPLIANSILWENRSFYYGPADSGVQVPYDLAGAKYALFPRGSGADQYWDLGVLGTGTLAPRYSVMTAPVGATNTGNPPQWALPAYFNGNQKQSIVAPELTTLIQTPAAFDEGGNFIRPMFGPLALTRIDSGLPLSDYHVTQFETGQPLFAGQAAGEALFTSLLQVPAPLRADLDGDSRVAVGVYPSRGADQFAPPTPPSISVEDVSISEGQSGATGLTFTVSLSKPASEPVTVQYATAAGTATGGLAGCAPTVSACDYITVPLSTLTFNPGETSRTVNVQVQGDQIWEADETFTLTLSSPSANASISDATAVGTIVNDDAMPTVSINDVSVLEGNSGRQNVTFTVTLTGGHASTVNLAFATAAGTASPGVLIFGTLLPSTADYVTTAGTRTFGPSNGTAPQTVTITVSVVGDTRVEPDETFFVNLSSPANATMVKGQGRGTIRNND